MKKGFVKIIITAAVGLLFLLGIGVAQTQEQSSLGTGTIRQLDTNEVKVSSNDTTKNYLENKLVAGSNVTLTTNNDGGNETITIASSGGGGGGSAIILDLGDDGTNESTDISEIAVATDTNSIFSEPTADKLLIDPTANWPNADTADALSANGANCSAGNAPLGVDASGAAEGCFDVWTEAENTAAAYLDSGDIGSTIQAYDSELAAIAGLTSAADRGIYFTGSGTASLFTLTGTGRSILDDSSTSAVRTTIGVGTSQSPQFAAVNVGNASDTTLARLSAGDLTVEGNLLYRAGGTDVPITDGGTGTSTASGARTNLGLAIGTDVQAWDAFLDDIGALTDPNDDRILFWDDSAGDIVWLDPDSSITISGTTISAAKDNSYVFVAASDATAREQTLADYTADGTADEVQINAALAAVKSAGGRVILSSGTFQLAAAVSLAGATANADANPMIILQGSGIDTTHIEGTGNINVIELTDQPKYQIGNFTLLVTGTGNAIDQQAGTERGNWQSVIHDIYIEGNFTDHTGWGMYLESPFRMRIENVEMNGVGGGAWLTSHVESFNPGNLSVDRMFVDLWNSASNSNGTGFYLTTTATTSTGHMNLVDVNRLDIAGGSSIPSVTGIHLRGATADPGGSYYGEVRQNSFHQLNIEDVDVAIKLEAASDNSFTDINYTRVLDDGIVFDLDDESLNNRFENTYLDSNTASITVNVINDQANDTAQPNVFSRIVGFSAGTATLNATTSASTILEHIDLAEGSPTIDSDLTEIRHWLGIQDFGAASSLEIPNGTGNTVDADGEIAHDTSADQLVYGADADVVDPRISKSFTIESPTSTDNFLLGKLPYGITVSAINCIVDPADTGESVVITMQERDSTGDNPAGLDGATTITCDNDGAADDGTLSNPGLDSGDWWGVDIGTITGTVTQLSVSVTYQVVRE